MILRHSQRKPRSNPGPSVQLATLIGLLLLAIFSGQMFAQTTYVAYGDSITSGTGDTEPEGQQAGYPVRLEQLLGGVSVLNRGQTGGTTTVLLAAFASEVLSEDAEVLLLMAGTNDVTRFASGAADAVGIEDTMRNLRVMAQRASGLGTRTIHATIIPRPPQARWDATNQDTQRFNNAIRHLAGTNTRDLVDVSERFREEDRRYALYYADRPGDPVGHPGPDGYDQIAEAFADVINAVDSSAPVPGILSPFDGEKRVERGARVLVDLWDFGTGIDPSTVEVLVNGTVTGVSPIVTGQRVTVNYTPPEKFLGKVTVIARASDRSTPPRTLDREIATFFTKQTTFPDGDINRDGRVDGKDLLILATGFGEDSTSFKYDPDADLDQDGDIDGFDLAILVENFGTSL